MSSASPTLHGGAHVLTDDHLNLSVPLTRHDDLGNLPLLAQSHDDTDNSIGFDVQHLLSSDYNGPNLLSQQPQPEWPTFSPRPITSDPTASSRITPSTSLQNGGGFSTAEMPASRLLPENSANNSSNGRPSPDLQWTVAGIRHNSMHTENSRSGSSIHPGGNRRPQSRRQHSYRPNTTSTSFVEQGAPLRPASRGNETCQSSHERCQPFPHAHYRHPTSSQSANSRTERPTSSGRASSLHDPHDRTQNYLSSQIPYRSTSDFGSASPLITDSVSPLQGANTHCSHCSCIARPESPLASPKLTSTRTSVPGPTCPIPHTPSSRKLEILAECSQTLRNLVHAPNANNLVDEPQLRSGESSRKSRRSSFAVCSPCSERNSVDEGYEGEMERRNGVEKVVIVYVNGKLEGKWVV